MSEDKRYEHVKEKLKSMGEGTADEVHAAPQSTPCSLGEARNQLDPLMESEADSFEKIGDRYRWKKSYKLRLGMS